MICLICLIALFVALAKASGPKQTGYVHKPNPQYDITTYDSSFGDDILTSPMYSFMSCNIYHSIDDNF